MFIKQLRDDQQFATKKKPNFFNGLAVFENAIKSSRSHFIEWTDSLPPVYNNLLRRHFKSRLENAHNSVLLGEYAILLTAELLDIVDRVEESNNAWFYIYEYCLFVDDMLDDNSLSKEAFLASQVLLNNALQQYANISSKNTLTFLNIYFNNWLYSNLPQNGVGNKQSVYSLEACKPGMVLFGAEHLSVLSRGTPLSDWEKLNLNKILEAFQLLDDFSDLENDITGDNRLNNSFLNLLVETTGSASMDNIYVASTRTDILQVLQQHGILKGFFETIYNNLIDAIIFFNVKNKPALRFLEFYAIAAKTVLDEISTKPNSQSLLSKMKLFHIIDWPNRQNQEDLASTLKSIPRASQ